MRIAIYGTGGVGAYFGGRLAQAGEDVVFIARGEHLKAIGEKGLKVDSVKNDFIVHPAEATDDPAQVGVVDMILVGVKAWQIPDAAQAMRPMVGPETFIVPIQNGVDAPDQLAEVLGAEHVLGGSCRIISFIVEPGHICHAGVEPSIAFGEMDGRTSERTERLQKVFGQAEGLTATILPDIKAAIWKKFLLMAPWSGLGALTRAPVGVLCSQPETRGMLEQLMQEIINISQARGISLPQTLIAKTLGFLDDLPPEGTASMQRDIMAGRPSELVSQNGAAVRIGQELGVETNLHAFVYHSLLPLERRARGELTFTIS